MMREPPKPSDPDWAAYNAPFTLHESESHPGTWVIRNKDDVPIDQGDKLKAEFIIELWNDDAARYWMQAP